MIYILTGIAKSGKSLLANEILKTKQIATFSTDYIMMMLQRGNNDLNIDIFASDPVVAKKIEPYIHGLIETMIENNDTYLIEGVHFNPDFSRKLLDEFKDKIKIVYLGYKDISLASKITELLKYKDSMSNPWLFHHLEYTLEEIVLYMIKDSKRVYEECLKQGLAYIDITDINTQKEHIITHLFK